MFFKQPRKFFSVSYFIIHKAFTGERHLTRSVNISEVRSIFLEGGKYIFWSGGCSNLLDSLFLEVNAI